MTLAGAADKVESSTDRMNTSLGTASNRARSYGTQVNKASRQTGGLVWQLNDIGVMLAAGQNPLMLAVQQGTQVTQIFDQMGSKTEAIKSVGAALRSMFTAFNFGVLAVIAGTAALGQWIIKMVTAEKETRTLDEVLDDLGKTVDSYKAATDDALMSTEKLDERFGSTARSARGVLDFLREIAESEARREIDGMAMALANLMQTRGDGDQRLGIAEFFDANIMLAFNAEQRETVRLTRSLSGEFLGLQRSLMAATGDLEAQVPIMENLIDAATELADLDGTRTVKEDELLGQLGRTLLLMYEQLAVSGKLTEDATARADAETRAAEAYAAAMRELQQNADMATMEFTFGGDSLEVFKARRELARQELEDRLRGKDVSEDQIAALGRQFDLNTAILVSLREQARVREEQGKATESIGRALSGLREKAMARVRESIQNAEVAEEERVVGILSDLRSGWNEERNENEEFAARMRAAIREGEIKQEQETAEFVAGIRDKLREEDLQNEREAAEIAGQLFKFMGEERVKNAEFVAGALAAIRQGEIQEEREGAEIAASLWRAMGDKRVQDAEFVASMRSSIRQAEIREEEEAQQRLLGLIEAASEAIVQAEQRNAEFASSRSQDLENSISMMEAELRYGRDSIEVVRERQRQERLSLEESARRQGIDQDILAGLLQQMDAAHGLEAALWLASQAASGISEQITPIQNAIRLATAAALGLRNALLSVMAVLGSVGTGMQALGGQIDDALGGAASNALGGVGGVIQGAISSVVGDGSAYAQAGRTLENLAQSAMVAAAAGVEVGESLEEAGGGAGKAADELSASEKAAKSLANTIKSSVVSAIDSFSNAWGDFITRGFKDFKGFVNGIWDSFRSLIADMIALAIKNRIMIAIGLSNPGATIGQALGATQQGVPILGALAGGGGGVLGGLGSLGTGLLGASPTFGTGLLGGLGSTASATLGAGGGLGGLFSIGGNAAAAGGGLMATLGAALPVIGIGLALFGLFRRKRKPIISSKDFSAIQRGLELTNMELLNTGKSGQRAARDLKKLAGGIDDFKDQTQSYYDEYFTDAEKLERVTEGINRAFKKLGAEVPENKKAFRDLVESQNLNTRSGRRMYAALLEIAPAFAEVANQASTLNQALTGFSGLASSFRTVQEQVFALATNGSAYSYADLANGATQALLGQILRAVQTGSVDQSRLLTDLRDLENRAQLQPET